jgi:hypothetical protein
MKCNFPFSVANWQQVIFIQTFNLAKQSTVPFALVHHVSWRIWRQKQEKFITVQDFPRIGNKLWLRVCIAFLCKLYVRFVQI